MTGNYSKQFSKNIMFNILNKYYPNFNITYPQSSDNNTNPAILSSVLNESNNSQLFVMFYDFDCKFIYDTTFVYNVEVFDKLRLEYLAEMVKAFANSDYMKGLKEFYNDKIEYGYKLLNQYSDRLEIKKMVKKELKQANNEINFLSNINKNQKNLEK